jgi:hypothetical protein
MFYLLPSLTQRLQLSNNREVNDFRDTQEELELYATVSYMLGNVILYPSGVDDLFVQIFKDFTLS